VRRSKEGQKRARKEKKKLVPKRGRVQAYDCEGALEAPLAAVSTTAPLFVRNLLLATGVGVVAVFCVGAAFRRGEGAAGAAVRLVVTLLAPATALAFTGIFVWPIAATASVAVAVLQGIGSVNRLLDRVRTMFRAFSPVTITALFAFASLLALRCASAMSTTPYEGDSLLYHLPMTAALLQDHSMWFTRASLYPGAAELGEALGSATTGTVNGVAVIEASEILVLFLAAFGWARQAGASREGATAAAIVAGTLPIVVDQMFTSQNDIFVCAMLASACALWRAQPRLAALALGIALATKVTAFLLVPAVMLVMVALEGWPFSLADVGWGLALALPWYLRTTILTGGPVYSIESLDWHSTIAGNFAKSWYWTLTALRNFGGLPAIAGIVALIFVVRKRNRPPFARATPWLAAVAYVAWALMPHGAESVPGSLDQIRSGWSIRHAMLLPFALATSLPIALDRIPRVPLAGVVALAVAVSGFVRAGNAIATQDPLAFVYTLSVAAVAICLILALVARRPTIALAWLSCAVVIWSAASTSGAMSMHRLWASRYLQWHMWIPASSVLTDPVLVRSSRVAVIGMRPFPLVGSTFSRRTYERIVRESPRTWLTQLRRDRVQVMVAASEAKSPDAPDFLKPLPEEAAIAAEPRVCLLRTYGYVRVYGLEASVCNPRGRGE
jgi:hypothetical protein